MERMQITPFAAVRRTAVSLGRWIKFRARAQAVPDALSTLAEIERLALLSPHLLADLGFRADPHVAGPGSMAWRKDGMTVTVEATLRSVCASEEGRASFGAGWNTPGKVSRHAL